MFYFFFIQKRTFRSMRFGYQTQHNSRLITFGLQFLLKQSVRYLNKILVILFAQLYVLFNVLKITKNNSTNIILNAMVSYIFHRPIKIVIYLVFSFARELKHTLSCMLMALKIFNAL